MFLEKHEPASIEEFTWFDEQGELIENQDSDVTLQISKINRYIVEVSQKNRIIIPSFIHWLFNKGYKIYCVSDCRNDVKDMSNVQKILFEREKERSKWVPIDNQNNIFFKEFTCLEDVELIWNTYLFISKKNIEIPIFTNLFEELNIISAGFPNLNFCRLLPLYKDLIIGKISWGESYFKPGTNEEPVVLVCYTAEKIPSY